MITTNEEGRLLMFYIMRNNLGIRGLNGSEPCKKLRIALRKNRSKSLKVKKEV